MKSEKNILAAFLLNLFFSAFEFAGGLLTGSVAILSDSVHDLGDALSIGVSWILERNSTKRPNEKYTYGYIRYSVLGSVITTVVLMAGSIIVIYSSIQRLINPTEINYNGMIILGVFGVVVNFIAAYITSKGESLNQKAVNLHMLEDVLGWVVVLIGAIIMRFTDIRIIDPAMSIGVATFIFVCAIKNLKAILDIFMEKTPDNMTVTEIKEHIMEIEGVEDVHHIHIWSMDGQRNYATLHVVTNANPKGIKDAVRKELEEHHIGHITIELESPGEDCHEVECKVEEVKEEGHHHHHHH